MAHTTFALDDLVSNVVSATGARGDRARVVPLIDPATSQREGVVLESVLERVAVFQRVQDSLSLADISHMRRAMARAQVPRAYLYIPLTAEIQKPVQLLATLSKIRIVRVEAPELEL